MHQFKKHLFVKVSAIVLVLAFLMPTVIKVAHNLEHEHKHELCDNPHETHFHKLEKDCDFCKFKLSQDYHSVVVNTILLKSQVITVCNYATYSYQYNHQHLSFSLRAPPVLV